MVAFLPRNLSFGSKCDPEGHINSAFVVFLIDVLLVCDLEMSLDNIFSTHYHQEQLSMGMKKRFKKMSEFSSKSRYYTEAEFNEWVKPSEMISPSPAK